jgi:hypothetical protein
MAAVDLVAAVHVPRAQEGALALSQELALVRRGVGAHQLQTEEEGN